MSAVANSIDADAGFSAINSSVAKVAVRAAGEAELLSHGIASDTKNISDLAQLLAHSRLSSPAPEDRRLVDPISRHVVEEAVATIVALEGIGKAHQLQSLAQVMEFLQKVVEGNRDASQLQSLKSFCLALGESVSASQHMYYKSESTHPFRR